LRLARGGYDMKVYYVFSYQASYYKEFKVNIILSDEKLSSIITSEITGFKNKLQCNDYIKNLKSSNNVNQHRFIKVNKVSDLRLNNIKKNIFNI
jgi:hypothetical protein